MVVSRLAAGIGGTQMGGSYANPCGFARGFGTFGRLMDLSAALLERDSELTVLDAAFDGAEDGRGAIVRVRGAAGLGKTRLLATAASIGAERGLLVLGAAGSELERE